MKTNLLNKGEASEKNIWLFSMGNFANNLIFMTVTLYIMYYYTNILGVSALMAGTIFMVARLVDAITDPLMGMIVDKTNTKRMGKYRPFIIFGAPFLGISFLLLFTTPNLSLGGKIVYAYASYILYSLTWTVVQIPQLALPIILSNNIARRTRIQAIFQATGAIAAMVIQSWALPMLEHFGGKDNPAAWTKVISIYAVIATIVFILSAMSVKELDVYSAHKDISSEAKPKMTFRQSYEAIIKNKALLAVLLAYGTDMFASQIGSSLRIYFFRYNLNGRTDLISYLGYVGLIAAFVMLFGIAPYVKKVGKRIGIAVVEAICIIFSLLLMYAAPRHNIPLVMVSFIANTFLFQITNTLSRSAVLDSANYMEIKTGHANNALISSTFTFVNKVSQAISAFFAGSILTFTGYNAQLQQQADGTLKAILYLLTIVPIVAYIFSLIGMWIYPISRKDEIEMEQKMIEIRTRKLEAGLNQIQPDIEI